MDISAALLSVGVFIIEILLGVTVGAQNHCKFNRERQLGVNLSHRKVTERRRLVTHLLPVSSSAERHTVHWWPYPEQSSSHC